MPRGFDIQKVAIGAGLLVVCVGAFALGSALSEKFKPLPAVVRTEAPSDVERPQLPAMPPPLPSTRGAGIQPSSSAPAAATGPGPAPSVATAPGVNDGSSSSPSSARRLPPSEPAPAAGHEIEAASLPQAAVPADQAAAERRAKARRDASGHWPAEAAAKAAESQPVVANSAAPVASGKVESPPSGVAPKGPESQPGRRLGFLAEMKGVPEAVAAIDTSGDAAARALDKLLEGVLDNRADPMAWSRLAAVLEQSGQRAAAIAVANRGMNAAKRQQDGDAVTRLTRQIAQLELSNGEVVKVEPTPGSKGAGGRRSEADSVPLRAPVTAPADAKDNAALSGALDEALRNNAATQALKILQQMAEGSIARGDYAAAQHAYGQAISLAHLSRLGEERADQYANLGRMYWQKGDRGEAEAYWRAARDQYEQFDLTAKAAEMNALLRQSSPAAMVSPSRPLQTGKKTSSIIELR